VAPKAAILIRHVYRVALLACLIVSSAEPASTAPEGAQPIPIETSPIEHFEIHSDESLFGPFEFVGGLELSSSDGRFGGMSGIRMLDDDRFIGVMDSGYWYFGTLIRDPQGRPTAVSDYAIAPLAGLAGKIAGEDWDAEGLVIDGDRVLVSFERNHRIESYPLDGIPEAHATALVPQLIPLREFRANRGMEAIAVAPADGPLKGAAVVVTEKSLDTKGDVFAAVLSGPRKGVFFVHRKDRYDVTDADFLPDGDLVVLERRFNLADGLGMRIRRIAADSIAPGKTVDGDTILEADFGNQIDNMEGLDIYRAGDGSTHMMLVSDDNRSILQRSLLLDFRLVDPALVGG